VVVRCRLSWGARWAGPAGVPPDTRLPFFPCCCARPALSPAAARASRSFRRVGLALLPSSYTHPPPHPSLFLSLSLPLPPLFNMARFSFLTTAVVGLVAAAVANAQAKVNTPTGLISA
jgi:hypothetical protein